MLRDHLHAASLKFAPALLLSPLLIPAGCDTSPEPVTAATSGYEAAEGATPAEPTVDRTVHISGFAPPSQPPTLPEVQVHQAGNTDTQQELDGTTVRFPTKHQRGSTRTGCSALKMVLISLSLIRRISGRKN